MDFETIKYSSPMNRDIMGAIRMYSTPMLGANDFGSIYGQNPMKAYAKHDEFVDANKQQIVEKRKKGVKYGLITGLTLLAMALIFKKTNLLKHPAVQKLVAKVKPLYTKVVAKAKPVIDKITQKAKPVFDKAKAVFTKILDKVKTFFKHTPKP